MTCKRIEPMLMRWVVGGLREGEGARVRDHLELCGGCRARLDDLRAGRELLGQFDALPAPAGMFQRALERRETSQRRWLSPRPYVPLSPAAAALVGVVLLGAAAYRGFPPPLGEAEHSALLPAPGRLSPGGGTVGRGSAERRTERNGGSERSVPGGHRHTIAAGTGSVRVRGAGPENGSPPEAPGDSDEPDDLRYLNGTEPGLIARWMTGDARDPGVRALLERLARVEVKDDFVRIPPPRFASAETGTPGAAGALRKYEAEARVVDPRLYRKITLKLKGASLEEFCEAFEKETGVRVRPARGVADEKVTVFVADLHARDVMRAVARLFGYFWSRSGAEGAYRYELYQDLKAQLAEEEMRNRDLNAALVAVDQEMQTYAPLLDLPLEQLKARAARAAGKEKERLERLLRGGWGMAQVFRHLAPAEIAALREGRMLTFSTENASPGRLLPAEWRTMLFATSGTQELDHRTGQPVEVGELPDARVLVDLRLKRSELGQFTLEGASAAFSPSTGLGGGIMRPLVVGQSPSVANPENARANAALRGKAPFTQQVTLRPVPQCLHLKRWYPLGTTFGSGARNEGAMEAPRPHVDSAEVWEEVHRRSGLPIVADYYTRLHDLQAVTLERGTLFEGLCQVGDRLGVRWHQDGAFLLGRSTSYFWDKLKEIPNRQIRRWQANAASERGLPLRDLLEMATLSDAQLNSVVTAEGMRRCRGLEEWGVVGGGEHRPLRPHARFLAQLRPEQLNQALTPAGLPLGGLTPDQQREWLRFQPPPPAEARLRVDYVPAGAYVWMPSVPSTALGERLSRLPVIWGKTAAEGAAAARKYYPDAAEQQFRRSLGVLSVSVASPAGETLQEGKPPVLLLPPTP